jgi:hypothetical protein
MSKSESQLVFIARLRDYCSEKIPSHYESEGPMAFMRNALQGMSESIMKLKHETLTDECVKFTKALDGGLTTEKGVDDFLALIGNLVPGGTATDIAGVLMKNKDPIENKDVIKRALLNVAPLSFLEEERKPIDQRPAAVEAQVSLAYRGLGFEDLIKELVRNPKEGIDHVLLKARQSVREYCCTLRIPMDDNDTLQPFMLVKAEAVVVANDRFLKKAREIESNSRFL